MINKYKKRVPQFSRKLKYHIYCLPVYNVVKKKVSNFRREKISKTIEKKIELLSIKKKTRLKCNKLIKIYGKFYLYIFIG